MKKLAALFLFISTIGNAQYLVPQGYDVEIDNYQSFISIDSVDYSLEFISSDNGLVTFWLNIENRSNHSVSLSEPTAKYHSSNGGYDPANEEHFKNAMNSKDVRNFYQKKINEAKTAKVLSTIFSVALIVADISADANDSHKFEWTRSDQRNLVSRKAFTGIGLGVSDVVNQSSHLRMINAKNELQYLPNEVFDKNIILPGETHSGKLVFRKIDLNNYNRIKITSNDATLNFDFRKANKKETKYLKSLN